MKKTIPITISGTLFYIEEDAFERLSEYLGSIKKHFASYADNAEIISDIENRVAERFLENKSKDNIVTILNVESLIASMGNVEDFDEGVDGEAPKEDKKSEGVARKLFRNPDDMIIGGVASGLAAYLGLDPLVVRVIFILVVFFGGSGVLIYIILWLIIPEAKTATEKLQMRGEKVTLGSVTEAVKDKINEVKQNEGKFRKIISIPFVVFGKIFRTVFPIIGRIIGVFFAIMGSVAILGLFFLLVTVIFNASSPYIDFPLMQMGNSFLVYLGLFGAFFVALVPVIFLVLLGLTIARNRNSFNGVATLSLLGIWSLSIITLGAISIRLIPEYRNFVETSPLYAEKEVEFALKDFSNLNVREGNKVHVTIGDEFKVLAKGADVSIQKLDLNVEDGTLNIEREEYFKVCIFCASRTPEIFVTLPKLDEATLVNGSRLEVEEIKSDKLSLRLSNGSQATLNVDLKTLDIEAENASYVKIDGKTETLLLDLQNASRVSAARLITQSTTVLARNGSMSDIQVEKTLKVDLENGSHLMYEGNPVIEKKTRNGSRLERRDYLR